MKTKFLFNLMLCVLFFGKANAQLLFPHSDLPLRDTAAVISYLIESNSELQLPGITLKPVFCNRSAASVHFTFDILYRQIPLLYASLKLNTDFAGKILSLKKENIRTEHLNILQIDEELQQLAAVDISKAMGNAAPVKDNLAKIDTRDEFPHLVWQVDVWNKTTDKILIVNRYGEIAETWDLSRFVKKDTLIHANIFKPDPLTVISQAYGAPYIDDNDLALSWFIPSYVISDIPATFETTDNTFYLENELVIIEDFQSPNIPVVTSATPDFFYNRSQGGFEQCNALYHISTFHDYISSIGYDTLMDIPITVDAQGMFGADNSMFNRNGGNPTLSFGTGGVDDAEDADVIIHEYSHALSWSANNNNFTAVQRSGLDEGLADYFATSYSRSINPFSWQKMFSWDGNNEFWGGRTAATTNNYPNGAGLYGFGEIWNSAMSAAWTDLGQIITDKLMLESMHFFTDNTTLPEAAIYVLQSDTILFNGIHTATLCMHFQNRNILDAACLPVGINDVVGEDPTKNIEIRNTYGFTFFNEPAIISFPVSTSGKCILMDLSGNKISTKVFSQQISLEIFPIELPRGIYFINVFTEKGSRSFKVIR